MIEQQGRDQWDSRLMFIITSIGAAVGLGNIWRFPYNAYEYGGGAFLIPYALVAVFVGFPIFVVEIALGQILQRGALDALRAVRPGEIHQWRRRECSSVYKRKRMCVCVCVCVCNSRPSPPRADAPRRLGLGPGILVRVVCGYHIL